MSRKRRNSGTESDDTVATDAPQDTTPHEETAIEETPQEEANPTSEDALTADNGETQPESEEHFTEELAENHEHNPPSQSSGGNRQLYITLVALLLLGGSLFYLWQQQQGLFNRLQSSQARIDMLQQEQEERFRALQAQRDTIPEHEHEALARQGEENSAMLARQQGLLHTLEQRIGQGERAWNVAEAKYLLRLARQHLVLQRDPVTTRTALRSARNRLELVDPTAFALVVRRIDENLKQLAEIPFPDRAAMAAELSRLASQAETLPLSHTAVDRAPLEPADAADNTATEQGGWSGIWNRLWRDIRGLVTIRREGEIERPTLAPEERYFLQQNLQLKLESARMALLAHNTRAWNATTTEAVDWLKRYYDLEAEPVKQTLASLEQLRAVNLDPALPDLGATLQLLQQTPLPLPPVDQSKATQTPQPATQAESETAAAETAEPSTPAEESEPAAEAPAKTTEPQTEEQPAAPAKAEDEADAAPAQPPSDVPQVTGEPQ